MKVREFDEKTLDKSKVWISFLKIIKEINNKVTCENYKVKSAKSDYNIIVYFDNSESYIAMWEYYPRGSECVSVKLEDAIPSEEQKRILFDIAEKIGVDKKLSLVTRVSTG